MYYQSNAEWPKECYDYDNGVTSDKHHTFSGANNVCEMLKSNGYGGDAVYFPKLTWVSVEFENENDALLIMENLNIIWGDKIFMIPKGTKINIETSAALTYLCANHSYRLALL